MSKPQAHSSQASSSKTPSHSESRLEVVPNVDFRSLFQRELASQVELVPQNYRKLCYLLDCENEVVSEFLKTRKNFVVPDDYHPQKEFSEQDVADRILEALRKESLPKLKFGFLIANTDTKKVGQKIGDFDFAEEFLRACHFGKDRAQLLFEAGADPTARDKYRGDPLITASSENWEDLVPKIIARAQEMGKPYNPQDLGKALVIVCKKQIKKEVTHLLLKKGADVTVKDRDGRTPLYYACTYGCMDLVQATIEKAEEKGSPYSQKDLTMAFVTACQSYREDIAKLLLSKNVDVDVRGYDQKTPLYFACVYGWSDLAENIIKRTNYNPQYLGELLVSSCKMKQEETAKLLLEKGADVTVKDKDEKTALNYAIANKLEIVANEIRKKTQILPPSSQSASSAPSTSPQPASSSNTRGDRCNIM